jgi:hypothetical protein
MLPESSQAGCADSSFYGISNAIILEKKTGGASVAGLENLAQAGGAVLGNERASIGA